MTTREPNQFSRAATRQALAELALRLFQKRGQTFTDGDMRQHLPYIRVDLLADWTVTDVIPRLLSTGIIEQRGRGTYRFRHQTFLEYLTAVALAHWLTLPAGSSDAGHEKILNVWKLIKQHRTQERWVEPLRLMAGVLVHEYDHTQRRVVRQWLEELAIEKDDHGCLVLALALRSLPEVDDTAAIDPTLTMSVLTKWTDSYLGGVRANRHALSNRLLTLVHEVRFLAPASLRIMIRLADPSS